MRIAIVGLLAGCSLGTVEVTPEHTGAFAVRAHLDRTLMKASGTMVSQGGALGSYDLRIGSCQSGEHHSYFGVDVSAPSSQDSSLRILVEPLDGTIKVAIPRAGVTPVPVLERSQCASFDVTVERTEGVRMDGYMLMSGHARIDCAVAGGHITTDITFESCG